MVKLSEKDIVEKCQSFVDNTYGKNLIKVFGEMNGHVYFCVYKKKFELPEDFAFKAYLSENEKGVVLNIYTGVCEENVEYCKCQGFYDNGAPITDCINQTFEFILENLEESYKIIGVTIESECVDDFCRIQLTSDDYCFPLDEFESKMKAFFKPSNYDASSGLIKR